MGIRMDRLQVNVEGERERERESGSVTQNEKVRKDKISIRRF